MPFLYEEYNVLSSRIDRNIPGFIIENLNPNFQLREYQIEAFARFFDYLNNYQSKEYPIHLLFNMATGSGKTLIMAGLILYLYDKGYRNFLFFVNSTNIIEKTKDNFLNNLSTKYLFNKKIYFNDKQVQIKKVDNFDGVNDKDINICFTTIQKLHGDLINEKENSLTPEDFKNKKIVLISDEAHHGQVQTKQQELFEKENWENTVINKIFKTNSDNLLLEFTATLDYTDKNIVEKYLNKVIYKYELKEFRNDGFSKDVELLHTDTDHKDRIIQAIILSQYRQEVAGKYGINLKPVILFKAQQTIAQSEGNKKLFHEIIENLRLEDINKIKKATNVEVLMKAFKFFKEHDITDAILIKKLKDSFAPNKCLSVNEEQEKEQYQLQLNSLEDKNNQIRAIFAVQKLNEGWDVLNLFDIVRLYETRDSKGNNPGKTTISEAQLIGRGARYYPFKVNDEQDKYKRKYDKALDSELRILEELYYHSHYESRYIAEIRAALVEQGMIDDNEEEVELILKETFKKSEFYKTGLVYSNRKVKKSFDKVKSIADLGVKSKNIVFSVLTGSSKQTQVFTDKADLDEKIISKGSKDVRIKDIEKHIIKNALCKSEFFTFESLKKYFPKIETVDDFINKDEYLRGLGITFEGNKKDLENLDNKTKFQAILNLLEQIELEIKSNLTDYQGTEEFEPSKFNLVFKDTKIKIKKGNERLDGQKDIVTDKDWYVFNANYGTSEEKGLVELINQQMDALQKKFKKVYLVRNERQLKLFNFKDGQAFEPDFLLFLVDRKGKEINYQLFLEPKGPHLVEHDKWKSKFLLEITKKYKNKIVVFSKTKKYRILGLPFYTQGLENEFKDELLEAIK